MPDFIFRKRDQLTILLLCGILAIFFFPMNEKRNKVSLPSDKIVFPAFQYEQRNGGTESASCWEGRLFNPRSVFMPEEEYLFFIDLNRADQDELCLLPGIGPALAGRILEYRGKNGCFERNEDLMNVKGIGKKKFEKIAPRLVQTDPNE